MKILIATDSYIHNMSGVTASVVALCTGLRNAGHDVRILSLSDSRKSYREEENYAIRSIPAFIYPDVRLSLALHDPLIRELEAWSPDVIHVQTEGSARLMARKISKHLGVPVVQTCHTDYGYFLFKRFRSLLPVRGFMSLLGKVVFRHAVVVTVPSRKAAGFPFVRSVRSRLTVVPNGMEIEKYQPRFSPEERLAFRRSLGIDDCERVLVSVSRLSREKNIRELIAFLPGLLSAGADNVKFLVVGDGPDKKHLEQLSEKLRLTERVVFTGRIPSADVWQYYAAGDVYVSASTFEVHSMSYLEALAAGLPLLCRADDALDGVLEHNRNGLVYHTREEFTDFARRLLKNDQLRETMARCSAEKAEDFSSDAFAASFIQVYEDAIRKNPAGAEQKTGK